jgi:hypothetical protein
MPNRVASLRLDVLTLDPEVQPRAVMAPGLIDDYAALMQDGHVFPPLVVFQDGSDYWLADGFHRVLAARQAGLTELEAEIRQGTRRDAMYYACGANQHGKGRNHADKERVVTRLLKDPEWRLMPFMHIARHCGVSAKFVRHLSTKLSWDDPKIAKPSERTVTRNGSTYTMQTSAIGHHVEVPAAVLLDPPTLAPVRPLVLIPDPPPVVDGNRPVFNKTNEMVERSSLSTIAR